ncbi:MAG: hypothetical protein QXE90_04160 [Candidatus Micrarchaeia archaeon]
MSKKIIAIIIMVTFLVNSAVYAFDPGCIAGGCEQDSQQQSATSLYEADDYECVCPPKDTVGTIIDIIGVLSIPFQFFSSKPNFVTGGTSLESLIKQGCKCRPKVKSQQETENTNTASTDYVK